MSEDRIEAYKIPYLNILRDHHERRIREGIEATIQQFTDRMARAETPTESFGVLRGLESFVEDLQGGALAKFYLKNPSGMERTKLARTLPFQYKGYATLKDAVEDFMKQNALASRGLAQLAKVSFGIVSRVRNPSKVDFASMGVRAKKGYVQSVGRIIKSMDVRPAERKAELWKLPPGIPEGYEYLAQV